MPSWKQSIKSHKFRFRDNFVINMHKSIDGEEDLLTQDRYKDEYSAREVYRPQIYRSDLM